MKQRKRKRRTKKISGKQLARRRKARRRKFDGITCTLLALFSNNPNNKYGMDNRCLKSDFVLGEIVVVLLKFGHVV
jgi:hypothetical protein